MKRKLTQREINVFDLAKKVVQSQVFPKYIVTRGAIPGAQEKRAADARNYPLVTNVDEDAKKVIFA